MKRNRYRGGDAERGADRLASDPVAFADDDVEDEDQDRLGNPVGLRPSQCHTDRGAPPKTRPKTIATTVATGSARWGPSTTSGRRSVA